MINNIIFIIYPMDPFGEKIGGIETFINNFVKHAPDYLGIEWIGISCNKKARPIGKWYESKLGRKKFRFLPILYVPEENVRSIVPLSLKFTLSLFMNRRKFSLDNKILEFHRIEPSIVFKKTNNKKILFVHGNAMDLYNPNAEIKWSKFPWLYFQIEKILINNMDKIFVVRQDAVDFYKQYYPSIEERFLFTPTFVDTNIFYPYSDSEREKKRYYFLSNQKMSPDSQLLLFVGRLEGQKDPILLIDTFNYISKSDLNATLLVVGDGALKKEMLARIEKYKLDGKVHFMGVLSQDEVAEVMSISDVFLLVSAFEGMPISVLEALASGLPIVTTDVGEVKRVVRSGISGFISAERKPELIGNLVLKVLNNKYKFRAGHCVDSIKDYTVEKVLERVYKIHIELSS